MLQETIWRIYHGIFTCSFSALSCFTQPGPDFFLVMQASLRFCFAICAGIAAANGVYLLFAVLSLEIVREASCFLTPMKYLGGAYLLFLGIALLRAPLQSFDNRDNESFLQVEDMQRQFLVGFMPAILNPKNAIFYLSLFTVMVSAETGFFTRFLYAFWMMSVVFLWDCCVVVLGRDAIKKRLGSGVYFIEKISGAVLAVFGIFLPFF